MSQARIRKEHPKAPWQHERMRKIFGEEDSGGNQARKAEWNTSKEQLVKMRRFRVGHSMELASYRIRIWLQ